MLKCTMVSNSLKVHKWFLMTCFKLGVILWYPSFRVMLATWNLKVKVLYSYTGWWHAQTSNIALIQPKLVKLIFTYIEWLSYKISWILRGKKRGWEWFVFEEVNWSPHMKDHYVYQFELIGADKNAWGSLDTSGANLSKRISRNTHFCRGEVDAYE